MVKITKVTQQLSKGGGMLVAISLAAVVGAL